LDLPVPAVEFSLSSEDRRAYWVLSQTTTGLPRFAPVRYDRGGCFLYSGVLVSLHGTGAVPMPRQECWLLLLTRYRRRNHRFRRPSLTKPPRKFTCVHPSDLPFARLARMVRVCLGHHPSAFARFVTWRLQGSGTWLDTSQEHDNESCSLKLERLRVASPLPNRTGFV